MPVSIVVGGQFGSEGKGKVAHWLAERRDASLAIRVGGPNSGHTAVSRDGRLRVFRQLPTPILHDRIVAIITAGAYLDLAVLRAEIECMAATPERLRIDPFAVIIDDEHKRAEEASITEAIASTGSGTGAALADRVRRMPGLRFARDVDMLAPYLSDTIVETRAALKRGERVIIEGTQGFGLSLLHAASYPFATSRDTTAAGALSESGLSPTDVDEIVLVLRAHPIRVGGQSGPLPNEISWAEVSSRLGPGIELSERTTVTRKIRRVADFDPGVVRRAIAANDPTTIVVNHLDYVPMDRDGDGHWRFIDMVEKQIGRRVDFVGLGPSTIAERDEVRAAG